MRKASQEVGFLCLLGTDVVCLGLLFLGWGFRCLCEDKCKNCKKETKFERILSKNVYICRMEESIKVNQWK